METNYKALYSFSNHYKCAYILGIETNHWLKFDRSESFCRLCHLVHIENKNHVFIKYLLYIDIRGRYSIIASNF